ncbi:MAG: hypothetical protein ABF276_02820 [Sulfurovum sp.]
MTKIAIPVNNTMGFYHSNPMTAPKFAIYTINIKNENVTFSLINIADNPWNRTNNGIYSPSQIDCSCNKEICSDIRHITEHYSILNVIHECDYLLVDNYCDNSLRALQNANIQTYKIPPFITHTHLAIKNFLLGASLASTFKHIHYAS